MNKKTLIVISAAVLAAIACAILISRCNNDDNNTEEQSPAGGGIKINTISHLSINEAHGTVGDGTSMHMLELLTDNGDTLQLDVVDQPVKGGAQIGEELQVVYAVTDTTMQMINAVNINALLHLWTQRGDDGKEQSLELNSGGRATTYDMSVMYDHWALKDGQLLLYSPRKLADESPEKADTFDIELLTDESLMLSHGPIVTEFECEN